MSMLAALLPQADYDLGYMDRIEIPNRSDCCQGRITCFQVELQDAQLVPHVQYPFVGVLGTYVFGDAVNNPANCNFRPPPAPPPFPPSPPSPPPSPPSPPPPPPSPPSPPSPPRPPPPAACATALGKRVRYVTLSWTGNCSTPSDGYLHMAEVRYFHMGQNVALNKATNSSPAFPGWVASSGVDGDSSTLYHSSGVGASVFWRVDLGVRCCQCCCIVCNTQTTTLYPLHRFSGCISH